jgi:hypothetical protein
MRKVSIYEFAGGDPAFLALTAAHHERCLQDPELNHPFSHGDDAGLPDDPDLRAALRAYMEWATEEVVSYAPAESQVPPDLPVPRWGWNGPE